MHRIRHAGWYLGADLEALLLVGLLLLAVNLNNQLSENLRLPDAAVVQLPALAESPEFEDLFPSGISGLTDPPDTALEGKPQPATDDLSEGDISNIENILYDLGDQLSEYPETTDIGDALQKGDLQNAAAAIERTADEVDLLPEDARQNMQQALQQASQQANSTGQQGLAEDLETAAKALENPDPNNPMAADALDDLADNLRDLGETFASMGQPGVEASSPPPENEPQVGSAGGSPGSGSGAGGTSTSEPITRLEGEGGDFTIEGSDTPSGLLQPGSSSGTPITSETGSTSVGSSQAGNFSGTNNSVLTPYRYLWSWRNVVSEYFSP